MFEPVSRIIIFSPVNTSSLFLYSLYVEISIKLFFLIQYREISSPNNIGLVLLSFNTLKSFPISKPLVIFTKEFKDNVLVFFIFIKLL